jgi:hypothetical protein
MPAAIAAGMAIGTGEGVGIASYQFVHSNSADEWGFRGFARSVFIGSTAGTAAGYLASVTMEPSPKTSMLLGSGVMWGTVIGSMFGYGGSNGAFGDANDVTSLGGLVGYNAGLVGAGALSMVWVPTYKSLAWMDGFRSRRWLSLPIYLSTQAAPDARRGLIFQGTAGTLGLLAARSSRSTRGLRLSDGPAFRGQAHRSAAGTGGGLMPVPGEWVPGLGLRSDAQRKPNSVEGARSGAPLPTQILPRKEGPGASVHKAVTTIGKSRQHFFAAAPEVSGAPRPDHSRRA